jgi:hypothetical protein
MNIDYTKLNKRIVKQAVESAKTHYGLTEEQKQQLFQNKIERARVMLAARNNQVESYIDLED